MCVALYVDKHLLFVHGFLHNKAPTKDTLSASTSVLCPFHQAYENGKTELAVHLVLRNNVQPSYEILHRISMMLKDYLPKDVTVTGYKCHQITFKPSSTTAKIDRKSYMKETEGYLLPCDKKLVSVSMKHN